MTIQINDPLVGLDGHICERILRALPEWFGIEEAILHYIEASQRLPTIVAHTDNHTAGFLSIKQHTPYAAEIYVMAVDPQYHRQGIGRAMVARAEAYLKENNMEFLQVKTLSASHPDPFYAKTRTFYQSIGFRPLEEFPTLWGESNPCLLMIKSLR